MIELKNVTKTIGEKEIVQDVSLTVRSGAVFGFLGPNGAGKTTTMKMLVGLNTPTTGSISIDGKDSREPEMREQIGFMPESPYFYEHLTGLEFITFCKDLFDSHKAKQSPEDLLKKVGLHDARNQKITTYSKGMKQRLAFAQALVNEPKYLFLDEPLDGLDPLGRRELKVIILELKKKGTTIFFNSHILSDTEEICDEIGILHEGNLIFAGPVKDFTKGKPLEEQFVTVIEDM